MAAGMQRHNCFSIAFLLMHTHIMVAPAHTQQAHTPACVSHTQAGKHKPQSPTKLL